MTHHAYRLALRKIEKLAEMSLGLIGSKGLHVETTPKTSAVNLIESFDSIKR